MVLFFFFSFFSGPSIRIIIVSFQSPKLSSRGKEREETLRINVILSVLFLQAKQTHQPVQSINVCALEVSFYTAGSD